MIMNYSGVRNIRDPTNNNKHENIRTGHGEGWLETCFSTTPPDKGEKVEKQPKNGQKLDSPTESAELVRK